GEESRRYRPVPCRPRAASPGRPANCCLEGSGTGFEGSFGTAKRRTAGLARQSKMARHKGRVSSSPPCACRLTLFAAPRGEGRLVELELEPIYRSAVMSPSPVGRSRPG